MMTMLTIIRMMVFMMRYALVFCCIVKIMFSFLIFCRGLTMILLFFLNSRWCERTAFWWLLDKEENSWQPVWWGKNNQLRLHYKPLLSGYLYKVVMVTFWPSRWQFLNFFHLNLVPWLQIQCTCNLALFWKYEGKYSLRQKVKIDCGPVFPWSLLLSIITLNQSQRCQPLEP